MYQEQHSQMCKEILRKNNLNPIKRLGKGGFGLVYLVSKTDFATYQTELFSVKCINKKNFVKKPVLRRYLKQEIMLLQNLHHSNIVKLIRTFEDDGWIFMVMEYCDMGNLTTIQNQKSNGIFSLQESKKIMNDVIEGLIYMHSKKIIHRDIKPENILLTKVNSEDDKTMTKICDLGFARQAQQQAQTFCGTTYYMAPEIFEKKKYNYKVDIWALGVVLFTMLFGTHPFKSINMKNQIQNKCQNGFDLFKIKNLRLSSISQPQKQLLWNLFRDIFVLDPEKRISLFQIRQRINEKRLSISKKDSLKDTAPSDSGDEEITEFYVQEVEFIQQIWRDVERMQFLTKMEELALKYYFDKVCLSIIYENSHNSSKGLEKKLKQSQLTASTTLKQNINCIGIKKFSEVFSSNSSTDFKSFKQAYRLVVGHAFYRAHKSIENPKVKNQMKLKLFCCHVINRVFDKMYVNELFKYYYDWLCEKKKPMVFNLKQLKGWIEEEKTEKIIETVEIINNRFYRKPK